MFRAISPEEFYKKGWTDSKQAPVLHMLVSRSNSISAWVASSILCQTTTNGRSRALARFVLIAQVWLSRLLVAYWYGKMLEEIGNYNSLTSVIGGFQLWAITRLQMVIPVLRLLVSGAHGVLLLLDEQDLQNSSSPSGVRLQLVTVANAI
jgi:hypothetical protein